MMATLQPPHYSRKSKTGSTRYVHPLSINLLLSTNGCSYELPQRVYAAKVYPLQAPNGSTVTVYSHEHGLTILWRGGRAPGAVIKMESQPGPKYSQFIIGDEEVEESKPYLPIVKQAHLTLGVAVQDISFPPLAPRPVRNSDSVVIAAVCSDLNVRVIAVPLDPTQNSRDIATISLQSIPSAVAITFFRATKQDSTSDLDDSDLLVASYASNRVGKIVFTRVPLEHSASGLRFADSPESLYTVSTTSLITAIAFNSSHISSDRHTHLLVANAQGSVRIFDPLLPPSHRRRIGRRGSDEEHSFRSAGSWIGCFYTSFETSKGVDVAAPASAHRKAILSAAWASEGRSIIALLSDGEWGVWDVSGGGPGGFTTSSSKSTFAIHGFVHGNLPSSVQTAAAEPKQPRGKRSSLAPMTPNTRKQKQENLFRGPAPSTISATLGGMCVQQMPTSSLAGVEDVVTFWYENVGYSIPSLRSLWGRIAKESRSGAGGSLYGPSLSRIEGIDVGGECIQSISQLPTNTPGPQSSQNDYLVTGEHRIIFLESQLPRGPARQLFTDSADTSAVDHSLLERGELDISGLDRMLDSMKGDEDIFMSGALNGTSKTRKVGFAS